MALFAQLNVTASLPNIEYWGVAVSPNAKWIACGPSGGGTQVQLLRRNPATGHYDQVKTITGLNIGTQAIYDLAFGPNSDSLYIPVPGSGIYRALLTSPGGVDQWDLDTSSGNNPLVATTNQIRGIAVSPDGLNCGYVDANGNIVVFNISTKAALLNVNLVQIGEDCKFSPDGRWFGAVIRGGNGMYVYSTTTWTAVTPSGITSANMCWSAEFSKDGNALVGAAVNGGTGSGKATYNGSAWAGATLQNTVAMSCATYLDNDLAVTIAQASSAILMYRGTTFTTETHNLPNMGAHAARGNQPLGSNKSKVLAIARVAASGSSIVAYELVDPFTQRTVPAGITGEYYGVAVSPDGNWIALGPAPGNGMPKILQKNSGDDNYGAVQQVTGLPTLTGNVSDMVFGPNSDSLYIPIDSKIHRCKLVSGVWTYDRQMAVTISSCAGIDVDAQERIMALSASNGASFLIDIASDTIIFSPAFGDTAQDVKFSPNGRYVAFALQNIGLRVYDRGASITDTFTNMPITGGGASVANWAVQFNENNDRIISGSIFSGTASSGFTLTNVSGTMTWVGQTLQASHNIVGATYMKGTRAITTSNNAVVPDIWDDTAFTPKTVPSIPAVASHAARAGRTGKGSGVLAICRTSGSGGGVVVYTLPVGLSFQVSASLAYPGFGATVQANTASKGTGVWGYGALTMSGNVNVPVGANGAISFAGLKVSGAAGAFPPDYPDMPEWKWRGIVGVENFSMDVSEEVPTETWLYAPIAYQKFVYEATGGPLVDIEDGQIVYPVYAIVAVGGKIEGEIDYTFPLFGVAAVMEDIDKLSADIVYPFAEVRCELKLDYKADGAIAFPRYVVSGTVEFVIANGDIVFPTFAVAVNAASSRTTGDLDFPAFTMSGDLEVPIGVVSAYAYPKMAMDGEINVPIGVLGNWLYPTLETDGVVGITNVIDDSDLLYSKFSVKAQIGYTHSVDAVVLYSKYQLSAMVLPPNKVEQGDIVFPKFATAIRVDNYYGTTMNVNLDMLFEGEVENTKRRKTINVFEH